MFNESMQIVKFSGKDTFIDVSADPFTIGKVVLRFRKYDTNKQQGSKINSQIDFYMSLEDLSVFCENILLEKYKNIIENRRKEIKDETFAMYEQRKRNGESFTLGQVKQAAEDNFSKEFIICEKFQGGSTKDGKITARIFTIEKGFKSYYVLKAYQGAGKQPDGKLIIPLFKFNDAPEKIFVPFTEDDLVLFAASCKRAISIYDTWNAFSKVEEQVKIRQNLYKNNN